MNSRFYGLLRLGFIFLDLLMINITFYIILNLNDDRISDAMRINYVYLWLFFNFAWIFASWLLRIYNEGTIAIFESFGHSTIRAYVYLLAITILYVFMFKADLSRRFIILLFISIAFVIMLNRIVYLIIMQMFKNMNLIRKRILIIGYNETAKRLVKQMEEDEIGTMIIGYCEDYEEVKELSNYPIVGGITEAIEISKRNNVTDIFSTVLPEQNPAIDHLIQMADQACIHFKIIPNFDLLVQFPVHVDFLGPIPVFSRRKEPLDDVSNQLKKRIFDLVFSTLVIVLVLSWLVPLISLIIWLESGRPIFFLQARNGKDNKTFNCIKFRSMKTNPDAHIRQATEKDDRITKFGKFLRKTSLDEFPQFINVFLGSMSIVGPRPHMLQHTDHYSRKINEYMVRQFMKPGITGWAQVNGFRGETKALAAMEKRVEHDLWYMENWSLWLDVRIIFLTVYNFLKGDSNAY